MTIFPLLPLETPTIVDSGATLSTTSASQITPPCNEFDPTPEFAYYANAGLNQYPTIDVVTGAAFFPDVTFDYVSFTE